MRTLYLPLKKEWYEMIERGEKLEEYREVTPYWSRRIMIDWGRGCPKRRACVDHPIYIALGGRIV